MLSFLPRLKEAAVADGLANELQQLVFRLADVSYLGAVRGDLVLCSVLCVVIVGLLLLIPAVHNLQELVPFDCFADLA